MEEEEVIQLDSLHVEETQDLVCCHQCNFVVDVGKLNALVIPEWAENQPAFKGDPLRVWDVRTAQGDQHETWDGGVNATDTNSAAPVARSRILMKRRVKYPWRGLVMAEA